MQRRAIADTLHLVSTLSVVSFVLFVLLLGLLLHLVTRARKRAEDQRIVRSRLAAIISTSLDAVLVVNRNGRVIEFNGAAEEIFGYARDEAIGARMDDLIVPEHYKDAHQAGMKRYLSSGEKHVIGKGQVQLEACRKNGEIFPVELSISTAESGDGEIFVSFLRDISRRVSAERELIEARDKAVAGERAKADLIAVMSHEMRTPLNGMLGMLELLEPDRLSAKDAGYVEIMRASGQQLLHHVDSVLDISRVEAGKISLKQEAFSLPALVRELVESQRSVAEHRGNTISYHVNTGGMDMVVSDPTRIRQVLLNLIGNAVKFTRNGSITLTATRQPETNIVEFRVADTGIGIDPADQDRVFDDFVTLDATYSRAVGGTGLGLAIVKRLVHALEGDVGLESTKGEGSVFWVRLPLPGQSADAPASEQETEVPPPQQEASSVAPLKILIVEDNHINRVILRDLLEQDGHMVMQATDGRMGVEMLHDNSFDLVLMNVSMPIMDGVEATRAIRKTEARGTRLPIIAVTAHALPADRERFRAAGLDDILIKPISRDGLRAIIKRYSKTGPAPDRALTDTDTAMDLLDFTHLDTLANALGEEKFNILFQEFLSETEKAIHDVSYSIETGTAGNALREKVHHASGSSAMFGAQALRRDLATVEERLLETGACDQAFARVLRQTWAKTERELRRYSKGT